MKLKLIVLLFLTLGIYTAKACKCKSSERVQEEFEKTNVIVSGKFLSKSYVSEESILTAEQLNLIQKKYKFDSQKLNSLKVESVIKIELEISTRYKGDGIQDKITIYTSKYGASCGYLQFEIGQDFIVYLSSLNYLNTLYGTSSSELKESDKQVVFWTNHCKRTKKFDKIEDKELRRLMNG